MPKGAVLVNTARKEVIDEEGLLKLMADRPDFKYISDIAPDNAAEYAPFEGRYFFTPKKWEPRPKRLILMPVLQLPVRL